MIRSGPCPRPGRSLYWRGLAPEDVFLWEPLTAALADGKGDQAAIIDEIMAAGTTSHNAIAAKLNERNVRTARGGTWTHVQVGAIFTLSTA